MIKKTKKNAYKISKTFLFSVLFSLFFWTLTKLSREYKTIVSFPIEYTNLPSDKLIQKAPLKDLSIQVKATGFKLLALNFTNKKVQLDAKNAKYKSGSEYYFLISNQKSEIQNQLTSTYDIDYIVQDTISLNMGLLKTKKVPVVGHFDLQYTLGYQLVNPLKITPDSIDVSGPESQIDSLKSLELADYKKYDIHRDIEVTLPIKPLGSSSKIKLSINKVQVTGQVDQFTEGTINTSFTIINLPDSITVNTFPQTVELKFQVGLSNFSKVSSSSFKIVCDYEYSISNGFHFLVPKIIEKPDFVSAVKIAPNKIDFLIQK